MAFLHVGKKQSQNSFYTFFGFDLCEIRNATKY